MYSIYINIQEQFCYLLGQTAPDGLFIEMQTMHDPEGMIVFSLYYMNNTFVDEWVDIYVIILNFVFYVYKLHKPLASRQK